MLTEEQEKALLEEIDKLRQDKAALISRVASLEQSLYWLRKKVFGRMSEKNLPLDPNQLFLFSKEEMSSMEISRMEDEVRKSDEEITRTIKVKEKPSRKPLDTSSLPVEVVDLYPEGTTDGEGRLKDDFIEIGKEESSRLERVPAKVYILKTVRHKVIRKSDMEKYPEERQILISSSSSCPGQQMYGRRLGPYGHYHRQVHVSSPVLPSDTAVSRIRNHHKRIYHVRMV